MAKKTDISVDPLLDFQVDYDSDLPTWIQIKNRIMYLIASGTYKPGDQLPTVRKLAVGLDISYNTVNRAYLDLERDGYVVTRRGRGSFVSEHPVLQAEEQDGSVSLLVDDMVRSAFNAGMGEDDIFELVKQRIQTIRSSRD